MPIHFSELDDIDIYKLVLDDNIPNFPSGFWAERNFIEAREVAIKLLRYLIDERLKFREEDIKREVSKKFLTKYKLHTASKLFGRSAVRYLISAYPGTKIQPWQFMQDKVPNRYWTKKENRISALRNLFEVELKWSINDISEKLNWDLLIENGLGTLHTYYPSLFQVVDAIYPSAINEWELRHSAVSPYFWNNKTNRKLAVRWLIKDKVNLSPTEALSKLKKEHFSQYGLTELLCNYYNYSVKKAINEAFERNLLQNEFRD